MGIKFLVFRLRNLLTKEKVYHTKAFWNITVHWTSHYDLTEKNSVDICHFPEMIRPKPCNLSGGQTHGWILPIFAVFSNQIDSILCRQSCFHRVWLPFPIIYTILNLSFVKKVWFIKILSKESYPRWKQLNLQTVE